MSERLADLIACDRTHECDATFHYDDCERRADVEIGSRNDV